VVEAGYWAKSFPEKITRGETMEDTLRLVYCVHGRGWCDAQAKRHEVREGDLLIIPPQIPYQLGSTKLHPWTIHWAGAVGRTIPEYVKELAPSPRLIVLPLGENLHLIHLFNEVLKGMAAGFSFVNLLLASHAMAHLIAVVIREGRTQPREAADKLQKVARSIIYMSESLDQSLKVSRLAALANLSPAHFTTLFKGQIGCGPRHYLHLLRMHRACELLSSTELSMKEIAAQLGYQDQFHFSRKFKAFKSVSPSRYRSMQPTASG